MAGVPGFQALLEGEPPFNPDGVAFAAWWNALSRRIGARDPVVLAADHTAVIADLGKVFFLGENTLTLSPAATLTSGWWCYAKGPGVIQPEGAETIGGVAPLNLAGSIKIVCDGVTFHAIEGAGAFAVCFPISGRPLDAELIEGHLFTDAVTFPAQFLRSRAHARIAPTASAVFALLLNDVEVGTLTFPAGTLDGVFASTASAPLEAEIGDQLDIEAPSPRDATLSGIKITLRGNR